jgi:hypothetical protein
MVPIPLCVEAARAWGAAVALLTHAEPTWLPGCEHLSCSCTAAHALILLRIMYERACLDFREVAIGRLRPHLSACLLPPPLSWSHLASKLINRHPARAQTPVTVA